MTARALPRRISPMYSSMWCGCSFRWSATCCGGTPSDWALRRMYWVRSFWSTLRLRSSATLSKMILALRACSARASMSAQNSSSVCVLVLGLVQILGQRQVGLAELAVDLLPTGLDLAIQQVLRHLDVELVEQRLQARRRGPGSPAPAGPGGSAARARSARISSMVSNSEASWANSSSASGSSCACTLLTVTSMSASSSFSGPPTSVEVNWARLAGGQPGDGLVQPVEHLPGADRVLQVVGRRVRQRLAVLAGHQADGDHVALGRRALDGLLGAEALSASASTCSSTSASGTSSGVDRGLDSVRSRAARSRAARRPRR